MPVRHRIGLVVTALGVPALIAVMLAVDHYVDLRGQIALGVLAFAILAAVCTRLDPHLRLQAALIVVVATCGEVLASLVWGLYTYRLENVPLFVPPGHALVYLGGLAVAHASAGGERFLVGLAVALVAVWAVAGVLVLPRQDLSGAAAAVLLVLVLLRRSRAHLFAGVFLVVASLELYGTAIGTWAWAKEVPSLGIPQGNPPSGAAVGYVVMEATAVRLAFRLRAVRWRRLAFRVA
ncbi:MAG TPA: hypothetical protein VGQ84_07795 [Gaiellaceae bacterium]|jgi:hypothetical protein|nr:hypothetical protein [Gaiellaceae bacterium]